MNNKEYAHSYYIKNAEKIKKQSSIRNKLKKKRNRDLVKKLKDNPCMDCGKSYPFWVMEFDHRDRTTKHDCIGTMLSGTWKIEKILAEIAKCDLVCANCHRTREYNRSFEKKHWVRSLVGEAGDS